MSFKFDSSAVAGPELISILINWGLFGALSLQVYSYFQIFPQDKPLLKATVCIVYILEIVQTLLLTQSVWTVFVSDYGNAARFNEIGTAWLSLPVIGGLVGLIVQSFYIYRISVFSRSKLVPGLIILHSIASFGAGLWSAVVAVQEKSFSAWFEAATTGGFPFIAFWGVTYALSDSLIAGSMCYYLRRRSPSRGFPQTQALIARLVRMTIETGLLTASISVLSIILYYLHSLKTTTYFAVPLVAHAISYSTTMLAVLNSRVKHRAAAGPQGETDMLVFVSHSRGLNGNDDGVGIGVPGSKDWEAVARNVENNVSVDPEGLDRRSGGGV